MELSANETIAVITIAVLGVAYLLYSLLDIINQRDDLWLEEAKLHATVFDLEAKLVIQKHRNEKTKTLNVELEKALRERILENVKLKEEAKES